METGDGRQEVGDRRRNTDLDGASEWARVLEGSGFNPILLILAAKLPAFIGRIGAVRSIGSGLNPIRERGMGFFPYLRS
jgi:hypothetical protein